MVTIDSDTVLNVGAAITAVLAVGLFVLNVDLGVSPVTGTVIVLAFLAGVFAVTQRVDEHQATALGYGVIIVSALILFFDLVSTFDANDAWTVLGLLVIAGVLFGLRTQTDAKHRLVAGDRATYAFAAVAIVAGLILAVDVVTGGLAYELQPAAEIQYSTGDRGADEIRIGTVVARNPTPLPERVDTPRYEACAAGNWSQYQIQRDHDEDERPVRAHVSVEDGYNEFVFGYGTRRFPIELHLRGTSLQEASFPVETGSACPDDDTGAPYIVLFEIDESRHPVTPDLTPPDRT